MSETGQSVLGQVIQTTSEGAICHLDRVALEQSREPDTLNHNMTSIGGLCKILIGPMLVVGSLIELAECPTDPSIIIATLEYVGEGRADERGNFATFRRGVSVFPHPGDPVRFAVNDDYQLIYSPPDLPHITVGTVYPTDSVRAPILFDLLLGRHFAIVGSSGSGKSTTVALLLQRIIEAAPHGHVVILDPHGEYARAFGSAARVWDVSNLRLPYWAMNLEEHCEAFISGDPVDRVVEGNILSKCLQRARARNLRIGATGRVTPDSPIPYRFADLTEALDEEAGRLEKIAEVHRYTQLRLTLEQFFGDERFGFIFNSDLWDASLEQLLAEIIRLPGEGSPISIVDLAGVPTEIVNVVVSVLSRLILDFAIRSTRISPAPVLLVCEEAHRYLPRVHNPATASVQRQLERLAREGRKYGVCLGLVSQRPSELSETALSQCGTIMSLRLNNENDQAQLRAAISEGGRAYVGVVPSLKNRECVISGEGVPVPMRVTIDEVAPEHRPASDDPEFSLAWREQGGEAELLARVVRGWRDRQ